MRLMSHPQNWIRLCLALLAVIFLFGACSNRLQAGEDPELETLRESVETLEARVDKLEAERDRSLQQALERLTEQLDALEKLQTGGADKTDGIDAASNTLAQRIERFEGHTKSVRAIAISPDGKWGASTAADGTLRIWDLHSHKVEKVVPMVERTSMGAVRFSPDGKSLLVASFISATMLDVGAWNTRWTAKASSGRGEDVAFSPDGQIVAIPTRDGAKQGIELRDVETGRTIKNLDVATDTIHAIALGPRGEELFVAGNYYGNGTTPITWYGRLWNWKTGQETLRMNYPIRSAAWDTERDRLYVVGQSHQVEEWDTNTGKQIRIWDDTSNGNWMLDLSDDGRYLALCLSGSVELWDAREAQRIDRVEMSELHLQHVALRNDGRYALVASSSANVFWGIQFQLPKPNEPREQATRHQSQPTAAASEGKIEPISRLATQDKPITAFALSPDGRHLYTAAHDHTFRKWDFESGKELDRHHSHLGWDGIDHVVRSRDGDRLLTSGFQSTLSHGVRVWDANGWTILRELGLNTTGEDDDRPSFVKNVRERVTAVALGPEARVAAVSYRNSEIRIWEVATGETLHTLTEPVRGMYDLAFSTDGKTLAAVGPDGVWTWDVKSGRETGRLSHHEQSAFSGGSVAFSPVTGNLLVPSRSGLLEVKIDEGNLASRVIVGPPGDNSRIGSAIYSPDGKLILAASRRGVYLFDAQTGVELANIPRENPIRSGLAFTPDGTRFLTAGTDNSIAVWPVPEKSATNDEAAAESSSPPAPE